MKRADVIECIKHCGSGKCAGCPYSAACNHLGLSQKAAEDAVQLLDIVTCGECRHRLQCLIAGEHDHGYDWYCADGERLTQTTIEL